MRVGVAPETYAAAESEILDFEFHEKLRERAAQEAATGLAEQVAGAHARVGARTRRSCASPRR